MRPQILVLDDPALGLDVVMRREFLDAMIELLSEHGSTVLLSSHIMTDVERIADRIGILHEGQLVVDASLDDIKRRVQRRAWKPREGEAPEAGAHLLRARAHRQGYDLTLLDPDPALLDALRLGGELGEAHVPTLEEFFLDVVAAEDSVPSAPAAARREEVLA